MTSSKGNDPVCHWTYERPDSNELRQGDILDRTPDVLALLRDVHPYFANQEKYLHFMLITQSCDLVRRDGSNCKAPYLTIAAVRELVDVVLQKELPRIGQDMAIGRYVRASHHEKVRMFLEGLLNNNDPNYFFLRADQTQGLGVDCCACLRVTVPLRVEHYSKLLAAKRGQLDATFQAKLGWLVGTNYSRVGTEDWNDDDYRKKEFQNLLNALLKNIKAIDNKRFDRILELIAEDKLERTEASLEALKKEKRSEVPTRRQRFKAAFNAVWPDSLQNPNRSVIRNQLLSDALVEELASSIEHALWPERERDHQMARRLSGEQLRACLTAFVDKALEHGWPEKQIPKRATFLASLEQHAEFISAVKE